MARYTSMELLRYLLFDVHQVNSLFKSDKFSHLDAEQAWKSLMGNGVNSYTQEVILKGTTLYVKLTSAVLREELSYGKQKIIAMLNEELRKDIIKDLVLR